MTSGVPPDPVSLTRRRVALTPRQRDILRLLCEGKVNKEIARELDIGLGTVKQHLVGLFKRLQVSNRSMAVSHGMALLAEDEDRLTPSAPSGVQSSDWTQTGILMRRPCVVASFALQAKALKEFGTPFDRLISRLACDAGALLLPLGLGAGDILFGIRRSSEQDLTAALQLIQVVTKRLAGEKAGYLVDLRVALNAGMAVVSRDRRGGWSGEVLASPVITANHGLLRETAKGHLGLGVAAREVLHSLGPGTAPPLPESLSLADLAQLFQVDCVLPNARTLHAGVWDSLAGLLDKGPREGVLYLQGEMGMGKSHLCRSLLAKCRSLGGEGRYFRAMPIEALYPLCDALTGESVSLEELVGVMGSPRIARPDLVVIDDFHLLSKDTRAQILARVPKTVDSGRILILAGRRLGRRLGNTLALEHLAENEVMSVLTELQPWSGRAESKQTLPRILALAAGVPLFAMELARSPGAEVNLTLLMIIASRLDGLDLDWKMLQHLAMSPDGLDIDTLARNLGDAKDQVKGAVGMATRAGVLRPSPDADGTVRFSHPLVREAVNLLCI